MAYRFSFTFSPAPSSAAAGSAGWFASVVAIDAIFDVVGNCITFLRFLGFLEVETVLPHWIDIVVFVLMRVFDKNQASALFKLN